MESEKKEATSLRGTRGSRGSRIMTNARGRASEKSSSPKPTQEKRESSRPEQAEPSRGNRNPTRGSRTSRRGQNRQIPRRNRRMRQPNRNNRRLERAQNALRNQARGIRGRFRFRRGFYSMRRRPFGRRSIFIAGLPPSVTRFNLAKLLGREGRYIRCTILRDYSGKSKGSAFAEMQNPRDAWKIIQKYNRREVFGNTLFVTFKRNPNRRNYYPRYNNRYGNNRQFNGYNPRYQRPFRPRGNRGRGRGGRNFQ